MAEPDRFLIYDLAYELNMRPADVMAMPASEATEWLEYFARKFPKQEPKSNDEG